MYMYTNSWICKQKILSSSRKKKHIVKNSANVNLKIQVHFDKYTRKIYIYIFCKIEIVLFKIYPTPMILVSTCCLFTFLQLFVYITFWKKGWEIQNFPPLTSFIFRVWHKCLLHGFWCQNFVFFLNSGRCGGSYFLLGHHFESFNYGNIAESLGNWQSSLTILELKKKFSWNYNVFCRNFLSILTCLSLFWSCNSTTTDNAQWARKFLKNLGQKNSWNELNNLRLFLPIFSLKRGNIKN